MSKKRKVISFILVLAMFFTSTNLSVGMAYANDSGNNINESTESTEILNTENNSNIAEINGTGYETLQAAVDAANGKTTITLLQTVEGNGVIVPAGKDIIFDFGGCTYTINTKTVGSTGTETNGFQLLKGSTVVMKNGTLNAGTSAKILVQKYCDLTLEDMNLVGGTQTSYVLSNNNAKTVLKGNTNITAVDGQFAFDAYYWPSNAYGDNYVTTENLTGTITGKIEHTHDNTATDEVANKHSGIQLSSGTYTVDPSAFLKEGYKVVQSQNEYQVVLDEANVLAKVGENYYKTLQDAVNAAKGKTTITLLKTVEGNGVKVPAGKDIIFDFGGCTYTINTKTVGSTGTETNGFQLLKGSTVVMKNGTLNAGTSAKILVQKYCDLTLEDMNLVGGTQTSYVLSNNNAKTVLKGNTNITAVDGQFAFDAYYWPSNTYGDNYVTTENLTGTITGKIEHTHDNTATDEVANKHSGIQLSSGTYTVDPSAFLAKGYGAVNLEGKWVVKSEAEIAAAAVDAKINALGDITLESKTAVEEAREAYNGLTNEAKELVKNLATLVAAEKKIADLEDVPPYIPPTPSPDPTPQPEPEKPAVPVEKPILPVEPPKEGADLGMTEDQQAETDSIIGGIVEDIVKPEVKPEPPVDPENPGEKPETPDPEKPEVPQTEAEKETAKTEEAIAEAAKNNEKINIKVDAEKVEEKTAPVEIKQEIAQIKETVTAALGDAGTKVLQFANIEVKAEAINDKGEVRELGNLKNIAQKISFTFQLPANTKGKNFGVVRIHDGKVEFIPMADISYDEKTKQITFKTNRFSTYAVYEYDENAPELQIASIDKIADQIFENGEVKPAIVVRNGKGEAVSTDAYTVTWEANAAVGTATVKVEGIAPYKGTATQNFEIIEQPVEPEQPAKPGVVEKVVVKTDNGLLKVTFDAIDGADGYRVYVKQKGNDWRWYNGNSKGTMIKKIYKKALVKNGQYQVKVVAMNAGVKGDDSKITTVYANRLGKKSSVMPQTKINRIKSYKGKITVYAKDVKFTSNPKKVAYQVSYKLKGTNKWIKIGYTFGNVKTVKGLKVGKTYNIALRYRYKSALDGKTFVYSKVAYQTKTVW